MLTMAVKNAALIEGRHHPFSLRAVERLVIRNKNAEIIFKDLHLVKNAGRMAVSRWQTSERVKIVPGRVLSTWPSAGFNIWE